MLNEKCCVINKIYDPIARTVTFIIRTDSGEEFSHQFPTISIPTSPEALALNISYDQQIKLFVTLCSQSGVTYTVITPNEPC